MILLPQKSHWITCISLCSHVTEAAKKQLDTLWHTTNIYYHPTIHEFAELMVSKMPGNLKVCCGFLRFPGHYTELKAVTELVAMATRKKIMTTKIITKVANAVTAQAWKWCHDNRYTFLKSRYRQNEKAW